MYEANYPEILKTCFIVNGKKEKNKIKLQVEIILKVNTDNFLFSAPKVFALGFSITKRFMNEYTISKIQIYKADPDRWKQEILKMVSKDQLPVHFGGTLTDENGNERLISKICQGGKVSKDLYLKNLDKDKNNEDFTTAVVKKGGKIKIDMIPQKIGSILSWEFRSEDHDIKFGIVKKNNSGEKIEVIPIHRVAAHQLDEVGVLTCEEPATCESQYFSFFFFLCN